MICKVCGNPKENKKFKIKEMMFGFEDIFEYFECSNCGCLQILNIPDDISKYYPSHFYSFNETNENLFKKYLRTQRNKFAYYKKGIVGKIWNKMYPAYFFDKISDINVNSKILDVGCGYGRLIKSFKAIGFDNISGIDPFIEEDFPMDNIFKKTIFEVSDNFDVIIFKDSFEHISNQLKTLQKVFDLLTDNGLCIITMPVKTELIWNRYNINWVQIDAPRHLIIHTLDSFELLLEKTGLKIKNVVFDSNEFQFWGSEQYKKGISLMADNSYLVNPKKSIFTQKQINDFRKKSKKLNGQKIGDHALFILEMKK